MTKRTKKDFYTYNLTRHSDGAHMLRVYNHDVEVGHYLFHYLPVKAKKYRQRMVDEMVQHLIRDDQYSRQGVTVLGHTNLK